MTGQTSFQRCDDEFEVIDEELKMSVMDSIDSISSWRSSPNIDRELEMLKQSLLKGAKRMFNTGTKPEELWPKVAEYCDNDVIATTEAVFNARKSKERLYWISGKAVLPYKNSPDPVVSETSIKRVIFSGNKTIILWQDGTKTIATCGDGDQFDPYTGFCAAITKRVCGSTSKAKRIVSKFTTKEVGNHDGMEKS